MINVKGLSIKFGEKTVLNNIDIELASGNIHGIVGLNGAGKTTFFNVLAKTLKTGTVYVYLNNAPISIRDSAYLETTNYFFSGITGNEYLKIFKQTNPAFNQQVIQEYFKLPLDELIENYSTGMKKKLAILSILKQDKPVFILDEPFNGLDLETNKILEIILATLKQKEKIILLSSHILEPLLTICDKIHLLENGQFIKTYERADFTSIDEALFGKLKQDAIKNIASAI